MGLSMKLPPIYLARHAETVFNRGARLQGQHGHSPLTTTGIGQAQAMAAAVRAHFGARPDIHFWCSTAGRTQQTAAILCDALELDYFDIRLDDRLQEIDVGDWTGITYQQLKDRHGDVLHPELRMFTVRPPNGEWYDDIARRMQSWLDAIAGETKPCLVISHGLASRVLRGLLVGGDDYDGTIIAGDLPQGTMVRIEDGMEIPLIVGSGSHDEQHAGKADV